MAPVIRLMPRSEILLVLVSMDLKVTTTLGNSGQLWRTTYAQEENMFWIGTLFGVVTAAAGRFIFDLCQKSEIVNMLLVIVSRPRTRQLVGTDASIAKAEQTAVELSARRAVGA